jgi:hypothetical protein
MAINDAVDAETGEYAFSTIGRWGAALNYHFFTYAAANDALFSATEP